MGSIGFTGKPGLVERRRAGKRIIHCGLSRKNDWTAR
jgi:hypothetical protein